uniref:Uncharacterized protein n=1 Tax=Helianthus annuus TaxID=4232 RepID=A0A251T7P6_HELAN
MQLTSGAHSNLSFSLDLEPKFQNSNNRDISNLSFSLDLEPYAPPYLQYPPSVPLPHAHKDEIR